MSTSPRPTCSTAQPAVERAAVRTRLAASRPLRDHSVRRASGRRAVSCSDEQRMVLGQVARQPAAHLALNRRRRFERHGYHHVGLASSNDLVVLGQLLAESCSDHHGRASCRTYWPLVLLPRVHRFPPSGGEAPQGPRIHPCRDLRANAEQLLRWSTTTPSPSEVRLNPGLRI